LTSDGTADGANAESGFTYDGQYLNIIGTQRTNTNTITGITGNTAIYSIPAISGCGGYVDYCITEDGGAKRVGTLIVVWDDSIATFTDYSSTDLNSSTEGFKFTVFGAGTDVNNNVVISSIVDSGTWNVKVSVRIIY